MVRPTNRKWVSSPWLYWFFEWDKWGQGPLITRVITHLLSGMNHQVPNLEVILPNLLEILRDCHGCDSGIFLVRTNQFFRECQRALNTAHIGMTGALNTSHKGMFLHVFTML